MTSELDLCQRILEIQTAEDVPSMNLAQAATVCLYECFKVARSSEGNPATGRELARGEELEAMFRHMRRTLLEIEFLDPQNPDHILRAFRSIFGRASLDAREVRIMQGMLSRIDWVEEDRRRRRQGG